MAEFAPAFAYILPNEGGYSNLVADKGGATNYGITQGVLDAWNEQYEGFPQSVKDLTVDQAGTIYATNYWPAGMEQIQSQAVASKMLDVFVNFGVGGGVKIIQEAVNTLITPALAVDGGLGPETIVNINQLSESDLLQAITDTLSARYQAIAAKDPSQSVFLKGWLARAARTPAIIAGGAGLLVLLIIGGIIWLGKRA